AYTRLAVERASQGVIAALQPCLALDDDAAAFTEADWHLQHELTILSGNPVFTLIYNSFSNLYQTLGEVYFRDPANRELSRGFYRELLGCAQNGEADCASALVGRVMVASRERWMQIRLWKKISHRDHKTCCIIVKREKQSPQERRESGLRREKRGLNGAQYAE
ncbi:FCD domain-containing protein, partial [bacterium]